MSLPVESARRLVETMRSSQLRNLIAQAKAKQVLREVREVPAHFPNFDPELDDRVTFIAYGLLSAACSLIEEAEIVEGYAELHAAADILESAHRTEVWANQSSVLHCLIGAMAFYACGQYSRAFVLMGSLEELTPSARIVAAFLRKDRQRLISQINAILLPPMPPFVESSGFDDWALTTCIARAVSLAAEYSISGEVGQLIAADDVLVDAMAISEGGSHPSFWWLARLLRLMLKNYGEGALWSVLPPFFDPDGKSYIDGYVRLLAFQKSPVIELWQSQRVALNLALDLKNRGGVINLRTSAGKTRVAEIAMLQVLRADSSAKILYLAPFKSLAFELERTFSKTLAPLGYSVSHLYGGSRFSSVDRDLFDGSSITIATPEKAKAMFRAAPELFDAVKLVVVDEGHLLGGNERNTRIEMFLEHLRLLANSRGARVLLLSAVLPNAEELATWIGGVPEALVKSNWKPSSERFGLLRWKKAGVSIEWLGGERCFNPHFITFKQVPKGKNGNRMFPSTKTEAVAATAVRLAEIGPVLIFAGQAQWVPSMVRSVLLSLGPDMPSHPWPDSEWRLLEAVCAEELGNDSLEITAARKGVVCHSNKLPPQVRIALEKLMAKYPPKIIVATTTLGQGVNIGVSSVIVATTFIGAKSQISKRDFWNICGRAGRAFVDGEGKILFAVDGTRSAWQVRNDEATAENYFDLSRLDSVESGLLQLVRYLHEIAEKEGVQFADFLELVANDSFDRYGEGRAKAEDMVDWIDDQLLALHVGYKGDDAVIDVEWVDVAFRDSLAAIQERSADKDFKSDLLINFLRARAAGVQRKISSPQARRAVISSGLPLSVGIEAYNQLGFFRSEVDRYLNAEGSEESLLELVSKFESWARLHAKNIVQTMPELGLLDQIRPRWLRGDALIKINQESGEAATVVCTDFYGYQLSWIFHSVAQKLDKETESSRVEALAKVGLLVELGLPTQVAASVFLAGVRSRVAAVELAQFVTDPTSSVTRIRNALVEPRTIEMLSSLVSDSTREWLRILSDEHGVPTAPAPQCARFRLAAPVDVNTLHVRQQTQEGSIFLCSTDGKFKYAVQSNADMPFDKFVNDPRFAFCRDGDEWFQMSRDPQFQPDFFSFFDLF